jgi:hypothetical protein
VVRVEFSLPDAVEASRDIFFQEQLEQKKTKDASIQPTAEGVSL